MSQQIAQPFDMVIRKANEDTPHARVNWTPEDDADNPIVNASHKSFKGTR